MVANYRVIYEVEEIKGEFKENEARLVEAIYNDLRR